ncbi:MAG TPA: DNA-3-methyladenine glycosylase [Thermoleophilia bacterium]|nr:DNA-3-methyladenine glycosylase [Thermoleophilia bacterium]
MPPEFFARPTGVVARELLGALLVRRLADGERLVLRLVETEAYLGAPDRASHAWAGRRTARNAALYLPAGHAYVYFVYGMHHCLNAVANEDGEGGAVLLRAGEPLAGTETMLRHRGLAAPAGRRALAGGPARLCRALAVDRVLDGVRFAPEGPLALLAGEPVGDGEIAVGPRVGIAYAGEAALWPLRFALRTSREVSLPRLRG